MYAKDYIIENLESVKYLKIERSEEDETKIKFSVGVIVEGLEVSVSIAIGGLQSDADIVKLMAPMLHQGIKAQVDGLLPTLKDVFGHEKTQEG